MIRILWLEDSDLYTVRQAIKAAKREGVIIDAFHTSELVFAADDSTTGVFHRGENIVTKYDAIIIRTFLPFVSESLTLAKIFHDAGKVVVDSSLVDEGYAISKMHDYIVLAAAGIDVPRSRQIFDIDQAEVFAETVGYPCILKGIHGSEGRHVHKVESREHLRRRFRRYLPGELMVQEFLPASEDYRVIVVGYKALPVYVSRKPGPDDFRTNFEFNEDVQPHSLSDWPQLQTLAEMAACALRREFTGVDIRCRGTTPLVLEVNRRPGFKGFEQATGYDVAGALVRYVINRCSDRRHGG